MNEAIGLLPVTGTKGCLTVRWRTELNPPVLPEPEQRLATAGLAGAKMIRYGVAHLVAGAVVVAGGPALVAAGAPGVRLNRSRARPRSVPNRFGSLRPHVIMAINWLFLLDQGRFGPLWTSLGSVWARWFSDCDLGCRRHRHSLLNVSVGRV